MECVDAYITPPWWSPPVTTILPRDDAIASHNEKLFSSAMAMAIYTDASGANEGIGTAAVALFSGVTRTAYIGKSKDYTVLFGELYAIRMALEIAQEAGRPAIIYSDSERALRMIQSPTRSSGQYLVKQIVTLLEQVQAELHWIPAHSGIPGNEAADFEAKVATGWRPDGTTAPPDEQPFGLRTMVGPLNAFLRRRAQLAWENTWSRDTTGAKTRELIPKPSTSVMKKYRHGQGRPYNSVLMQIRTANIALNEFLHKYGHAESKACSCDDYTTQSPRHVLLECPRWTDLRERYLWKGKSARTRTRTTEATETARPEDTRRTTTDYRLLITDPTFSLRAADFMIRTGLLPQFNWFREALLEREGYPADTEDDA
jgi:ribonuclease HI